MGNGGMTFGDVHQNVTGAGSVGQIGENTATVTNNNGADPAWPDAIEEARTEAGDGAAQDVKTLQAVAEIEQEEVPDEVAQEARTALDRLKAAAPGALRIVSTLIRKGRKEGAATGVDMLADWIED